MGIRVKVFVVEENGVRRIPYIRLQRLESGDVDERLPEYAGTRIRLVCVTVHTENRNPIDIIELDCRLVTVTKHGMFDQRERRTRMLTAMNALAFDLEDLPVNVLDASAVFAQKKYRNKYTWIPTREEANKIIQLTFQSPNSK